MNFMNFVMVERYKERTKQTLWLCISFLFIYIAIEASNAKEELNAQEVLNTKEVSNIKEESNARKESDSQEVSNNLANNRPLYDTSFNF